MSDTARDYKYIEPASTEGLEDLFVVSATPAQASADQGQAKASQGQATPDHLSTILTIDDAAATLGVSSRTILRRLQKQSMPGFKVQGQFGPEWRVTFIQSQTTPAQASADQGQANASQGQATPDQGEPASVDSELVNELRRQITDLKNELEDKLSVAQREIQAAAFRNGYLESQLENERQQVKLLSDSQHKPSRWARFPKWFIGR